MLSVPVAAIAIMPGFGSRISASFRNDTLLLIAVVASCKRATFSFAVVAAQSFHVCGAAGRGCPPRDRRDRGKRRAAFPGDYLPSIPDMRSTTFMIAAESSSASPVPISALRC